MLYHRAFANMRDEPLEKGITEKVMNFALNDKSFWRGFCEISYGAGFLQDPTSSKEDKLQGLQIIKKVFCSDVFLRLI